MRAQFNSRLNLERLEDRTTPAGTFTWLGTDATSPTDFFTKANWSYAGTDAHDYPGQMNRNDDKIVFDNNASANCEATLTGDLSVLSLQLKSNFTKAFTVTGPKGVIVREQGTNKADFELAGGALTLKSAAFLSLEKVGTDVGGNPQAVWSGGDLSSGGDSDTRVFLFDTTFLVKESAEKLGSTLVIGQSKAGTDGGSTVYVGDIGYNLAGNLKLYKNADIQVKPLGTLYLGQEVNTDTKGGIDVDSATSTSKIDNEGTISRPYKDRTSLDNFLLIKPKLTNKADGSKVILAAQTRVNFAGGAELLKGEYKATPGAQAKGVVKVMGGAIQLDSTGLAPGTYTVSFLDSLEVTSGELKAGPVNGVFFNIVVGGDLTLGPAAVLMLNANGSLGGQCDTLSVAGQTHIEGATLVVTTQGAPPRAGAIYDFLQSAGGASGSGWAGLVELGIPVDYIFLSLGRFMTAAQLIRR